MRRIRTILTFDEIVRKYATVLQVEFGQITMPPKRGDAETVEPVLDTPEPAKPRARKKPKRKSRATHR